MSDFRDYLERTIGVSPEAFAHASGVPFPVLVGLSEGRIAIDPLHKEAIKRVLPDIPEALFVARASKRPVVTRVAKGRPRHDDDVIVAVPAGDMEIGDYVSIDPPKSEKFSWWARVTDLTVQRSEVRFVLEGDIEVVTHQKSMAVISRPRR